MLHRSARFVLWSFQLHWPRELNKSATKEKLKADDLQLNPPINHPSSCGEMIIYQSEAEKTFSNDGVYGRSGSSGKMTKVYYILIS